MNAEALGVGEMQGRRHMSHPRDWQLLCADKDAPQVADNAERRN